MKLSAESNKQVNARLQSPAALTRLEPVINFPTGRRWEPIFLSSRSEERRISGIFERRSTPK
jgi:hypothetical protein